jgi:predicted deacylase
MLKTQKKERNNLKDFIINKEVVKPGEDKQINLNIANLPSRTQIDIPIFVSRSNVEGPTLLLLAGMHGDEVNSMEILRQAMVKKYNKPTAGSTITIPVLNIYGFLNFSRYLANGKDINRSFPGSKSGSLASRVALVFMTEILPLVDYGIDFHTGGESRTNYPQIRCDFKDEKSLELANIFAAPFTINAALRPKSLRLVASKKKKPIIVYEGGEALRYDKLAIDEGLKGIVKVMNYLGMTNFKPTSNTNESVVLQKMLWIRAHSSGLFHPKVQYGDFVKKATVVGTITDAYGDFEKRVTAPQEGYVIGLNNMPVVNQGDPLINVGVR